MDHLKEMLETLRDVTKDCRESMHEPDEQGIKVRVIGDHLDNAMGDSISDVAIIEGFQEYIVVIEREWYDSNDGHFRQSRDNFNLANLIALARKADLGK